MLQQQKKISNGFDILFLLLQHFFGEKMLCNKNNASGDTRFFFVKLQQFEKFVAIS